MPVYNITYETENYYNYPVREAVLELMVLPEESGIQKNLNFAVQNSMEVEPWVAWSLYGAKLIRFRVPRKFCSFKVTVHSSIEVSDYNPFDFLPIAEEEQIAAINSFDFAIDFHRYLSGTTLTRVEEAALPAETQRQPHEVLFDYMQRINQWVSGFIKYQTGVTNTQTTLAEVVSLKSGVCQDYSHLFIAILRSNNIPARYVSGYLNQGNSFLGSAAMHAWAEAYLPGSGWLGFDPSNNLMVNTQFIKVGHGLDYNDCMPIKGILVSSGTGHTEYSVKVTEQQNQ
jgi:transglutaminase-like putative cysteine protease